MRTFSYIVLLFTLSIVVYLLKISGSVYLVFSLFFLLSTLGLLSLYINNIELQNRLVKLLIFIFYISSFVSFTNVGEDDKLLNGINQSVVSYYLSLLGFLGIMILSIYPNNIGKAKNIFEVKVLLFITSFITAIGFLYYLTSWLLTFQRFRNGSKYAQYLGKLIIISLIVITFIGILVLNGDLILLPVHDGIKKLDIGKYSLLNLIYTLIIYIPCFLIDSAKFLNNEFNIAKNETRILLFFELLLIILYIYYPKIIKMITVQDGVVLLDEPRYLDSYYELGTTKDLGLKKTSWNPFKNKYKKNIIYSDKTLEAKKLAEKYSKESVQATWDASFARIDAANYSSNNFLSDIEIEDLSGNADELIRLKNNWDTSYNYLLDQDISGSYKDEDDKLLKYALSLWVYINPLSSDMRIAAVNQTEIFNFGDKISIEYSGSTNSLLFLGKDLDVMPVTIHTETNVNLQKWYNIILNYSGSIVDIFINGKLVGSYKDLILNDDYYLITVGNENGVAGSINNVVYYPNELKISRIKEISKY